MRIVLTFSAALLLAACNPPNSTEHAIDPQSFVGHWYAVRPEGVTTFHSDSTFEADGSIEVRFYACLSNQYESRWTDRGSWSWQGNVLTTTLISGFEDERKGESYTNEYTLLEHDLDRRVLSNIADDYTFWMKRRWSDTPYTCSTTKADVDADRDAAMADGRFQSIYPDYTENES